MSPMGPFKQNKNYGLRGGKLTPPETSSQELARMLAVESQRNDNYQKWYGPLAQLYVEMGTDKAEHHANWGV